MLSVRLCLLAVLLSSCHVGALPMGLFVATDAYSEVQPPPFSTKAPKMMLRDDSVVGQSAEELCQYVFRLVAG